jgi:hypothetical protein
MKSSVPESGPNPFPASITFENVRPETFFRLLLCLNSSTRGVVAFSGTKDSPSTLLPCSDVEVFYALRTRHGDALFPARTKFYSGFEKRCINTPSSPA